MPAKKVPAKDALKKTKKNFKKVFTDDGEDGNFAYANGYISSKILRELINVFDALQMCPLDETVTTANYDIFSAIRDVLDDILPVSEHNEEASELTDVLTSSHMKGFVEAVSNVAAREFVPQIHILTVSHANSLHSLRSADPHTSINRSVTDMSALLPDLTGENPYQSHASLSYRQTAPRSHGGSHSDFYNGGEYNIDPNLDDDDEVRDLDELSSTLNNGVTLVGIPKDKGENLGMTVGIRILNLDGQGARATVVVERVMAGSKIEKRRLLAPGDVITELNGTIIDSPDLFQRLMRAADGIVTLKVYPVTRSKQHSSHLYVRAFFAYDPAYDTLIPCKEAGLSFMPGDILQVLDQQDMFWWQARHVLANERAGLIPTEYLEERRRAHLMNAKDPNEIKYKMFGFGLGKKKKKVKVGYSVNEAADFDRSDIMMYEEVTRIPGFKRPIICLLGSAGVGRSTIRDEILRRFPNKYASPIRDTSRERRPTELPNKYNFIEPELMRMEHAAHHYVDFGELNETMYGVHLRTVREIVRTGRTCLIDCSAEGVRCLRSTEFMPWVLFLAAPSIDCMRAMYEYGMQSGLTDKYKNDEDFHNAVEESIETEREYRHLFDDVLVVDNMSATFESILAKLDHLESTAQWVPAKWVY